MSGSEGPGNPAWDIIEAGALEGLSDAVHRREADGPERRHG
jgi:hypothetical protein